MNFILLAVISLGAIGASGAFILYIVSKKFEVNEDPRIAEIQGILPAANCGGCGYPGCSNFASVCVNADSSKNLFCPVGGSETMTKISVILGRELGISVPTVAVVHCNGHCSNRPHTNIYDGTRTCSVASSLYGGHTDCSFGCLGLGDCVKVCSFGAIRINQETHLPEVDENKCTSCGACVNACPKLLIKLRKQGAKSRRIYVGCMNKDKGGLARKACNAACIGCSKCQKVCPFEAISIEKNLAYIDDNKCRLCRKCVGECPTSAIVELNFPQRNTDASILNS